MAFYASLHLAIFRRVDILRIIFNTRFISMLPPSPIKLVQDFVLKATRCEFPSGIVPNPKPQVTFEAVRNDWQKLPRALVAIDEERLRHRASRRPVTAPPTKTLIALDDLSLCLVTLLDGNRLSSGSSAQQNPKSELVKEEEAASSRADPTHKPTGTPKGGGGKVSSPKQQPPEDDDDDDDDDDDGPPARAVSFLSTSSKSWLRDADAARRLLLKDEQSWARCVSYARPPLRWPVCRSRRLMERLPVLALVLNIRPILERP
ncbi:hypothetical protein CKAH01_00600 [Colletotrichum kahawae]|uniref:Uncharacterized protein n=1 Tax=Colletotrichum kahawae TaxID=34407 RepID=A0AAD9YJB6_COLKA|nr:hypothetical protein CKAH01_00600 [Colletotrichum kahawae]